MENKRVPVPTYVAYHEAGHAIVAVVEKVGFKHVTIEKTDQALGRLVFERKLPAEVQTLRERDLLERLARVALAGSIAQRQHDERSYEAYCDDADRHTVGAIMERLSPGREDVFTAYLSFLEARTREIVDDYWEELDRCARLLLDRRTVSATAVRRIIDGF